MTRGMTEVEPMLKCFMISIPWFITGRRVNNWIIFFFNQTTYALKPQVSEFKIYSFRHFLAKKQNI